MHTYEAYRLEETKRDGSVLLRGLKFPLSAKGVATFQRLRRFLRIHEQPRTLQCVYHRMPGLQQ